jgi:hypothetical protein
LKFGSVSIVCSVTVPPSTSFRDDRQLHLSCCDPNRNIHWSLTKQSNTVRHTPPLAGNTWSSGHS